MDENVVFVVNVWEIDLITEKNNQINVNNHN